jgi:predicted signal transduction protein with EAL and GGDEF domain
VARRLRESTGADGVAARLGGDEFAVLLTSPPGDVVARAHRLQEALSRPVEVEGAAHFVGVSVGAAVLPHHGHTLEELLRNANVAMYQATRARGGVRLYDPGTVEGAADMELAAELMTAIDTEQVRLAFQPIHDARTGEVAGVEALARWNRPGHGPMPPDRFVALAERAGLIRGLTRLTLRLALDEVAVWRRLRVSLPVSVNLSPFLVADESLPEHVAGELATRGLNPGCLVLEVTESGAVEADGVAVGVLQRLRAMGVRIELDDFGSGYASFSAMAGLPLDGVKLDRGLVVEQAKADEPRLLAASVEMAHALGLTVVAEGIEDEALLALVRGIGCDLVQGYLLGRPMPPEELRARIGCADLVTSAPNQP